MENANSKHPSTHCEMSTTFGSNMSGKSESIRHDTFFMYLCNQKMDEFHIGSQMVESISISEDLSYFNEF